MNQLLNRRYVVKTGLALTLAALEFAPSAARAQTWGGPTRLTPYPNRTPGAPTPFVRATPAYGMMPQMHRSYAPKLPTPQQPRAWSKMTFQTHVPAYRGAPAYKGTVDLRPTIQRVGKPGPRLGPNDGGVFRGNFQNGASVLRPQRPGYYREFVVPTPGVQGPGRQRLVVGQRGEMYYTPNHYQSFRQVR